MPAEPTLSPGTRLGPYEVLAAIASGGMGCVYRARDPRLARDVAIKVTSERFTHQFPIEAQAIAALNHPNICTVYDVGPDYLVMELVEGDTLATRLVAGALRLAEALAIARQIAAALDEAHRKGILHCDLKPSNIMLSPCRCPATGARLVKVLDFGLARASSEETTEIVPVTVLGTCAYMSPEQAEGRPLDARSDVFSFGAMLYEMFSGRRPFAGQSSRDVMVAVVCAEPSRLCTLPPGLDRTIRRCLEKDPARRFQTMSEVSAALDACDDFSRLEPDAVQHPEVPAHLGRQVLDVRQVIPVERVGHIVATNGDRAHAAASLKRIRRVKPQKLVAVG